MEASFFGETIPMHRIVKAHLDSFVNSHGLAGDSESSQFEQFANFAIISSRISSDYDLDDVTTGEGDDGIDGIAVLIDETVVVSPEDASSIFAVNRRNHDVDILFIQAKRSESFDLGAFLKFKESILRFVNAATYTVPDEVQTTARGVFDVVLRNVPKIRGGKPSLIARYVTTGVYQVPEALESAKRDFTLQLNELGLFANIDVKFIGRDELTALWVGTYSGTNARLEMFSNAPLPPIAGVEEAYLAVVKAKELVDKLLVSEDGNLRTHVFEENVRSFLGLDNPVNRSISETINTKQSATRFPVLNNGITIVSPDVRVQGNILHLENFQIVNGCQTSNVLYENRLALDDNIMVSLKVVETSNEDVFSELVRATNSQTKVEETQFLSLRPMSRKIEQYFNTYEGSEGRLYFERRDRQYVGKEIPAIRIFSIEHAAKCVASMYCQRPDLAFRFRREMYKELTEIMFAEDNKEGVFYSACLTLYRLHLLVSNRVIPQNMRRFKWHMLALVRALVCEKRQVRLNAKEAEKQADEIIGIMAQHGEQATEVFNKVVAIIQSFGEITDDRLKRQAILNEMLEKVQ